jgi:hypothetical protein
MSGLEPLVARVQRAQIIDTATLRGLLSP